MSKKPGFQVVLYYVTAPSEEQLQGIWNFVLGKYVNDDRSAEDIDFSVEYDESLGGGFILKCGNEVYNWSTRGRLGQFNEKLQAIRKNVGADEDVISILRTTTDEFRLAAAVADLFFLDQLAAFVKSLELFRGDGDEGQGSGKLPDDGFYYSVSVKE